jgi:polyphosphate kinase 2 (PPK2 family)
MKPKEYSKKLQSLQVGLCRLQDWVKYKGLRVIVTFEGRDAAGKRATLGDYSVTVGLDQLIHCHHSKPLICFK